MREVLTGGVAVGIAVRVVQSKACGGRQLQGNHQYMREGLQVGAGLGFTGRNAQHQF